MMKKYESRIRYIKGFTELCKDIYLVPHCTDGLDKLGKQTGIYIKQGHRLIPDCFEHEQSLVIRSEKGLVIFNSCSHGGADNIINETAHFFPGEKIYALIGGFHLYKSDEKRVRALAENISKTGIEKIYTGHCTGEKAFAILKEELGDKALELYSGLEIDA